MCANKNLTAIAVTAKDKQLRKNKKKEKNTRIEVGEMLHTFKNVYNAVLHRIVV